MAKEQKVTELSKPTVKSRPLSYEEYKNILILAKKIRLENAELLKNAETPDDKINVLKQLFIQYNIPLKTSSGDREKDHSVVLKMNILLPDNEKFLMDYKNLKKNPRFIAEAYKIPAPFVYWKLAEIANYEQYIAQIKKDGELEKPILENNSSLEATPEIASSESSKTNSSSLPKKGKISKKKNPNTSPISNTDKKSSSNNPTLEQTTSSTGIINEELLHHIDSMQRYCNRLLDQNEQLGSKNDSLINFNKKLEEILKGLQTENNNLKNQITLVASEKRDLEAQVEQLIKEKTALSNSSSNFPRTIADETATERELRQEIAQLKCTNQELTDNLISEEQKKNNYRKRAVVAETQLEQLQHGMRGIFKEVDALDLSFSESTRKKI